MSEAELIQAMHEQRAPDLEYTPITAPLPELVRPADVAALREEAARLRMINERLARENMTLSELAADRWRVIAELEAQLSLVDRYGKWIRGTRKPAPFAVWLERVKGLFDLVDEAQP